MIRVWSPGLLLAVPLLTYAVSYFYMALFHNQWWLWNAVVHESGKLTLLATALYASHFLGHFPSLMIIAVLLTAWLRVLTPDTPPARCDTRWLGAAFVFVALCFVGSVWYFGWNDTLDYLFLRKQSDVRNEPGGSFLLHLPSTLSLVILLPLYLATALWAFGKRIVWRPREAVVVVAATICALLVALLTSGSVSSIAHALTDPRYLAHSARELATFPLTFFPIPLALWFGRLANGEIGTSAKWWLLSLAALSVPLLAYQVWLPLQVGVSELAQQPGFSTEPLPLGYLWSAHNYEHVLDTAFFSLICLSLYGLRGVRR